MINTVRGWPFIQIFR